MSRVCIQQIQPCVCVGGVHMRDLKNLLKAVLGGRREAEHAEMADEPRGHRVTTSTRGRTCCRYGHVLQDKNIYNTHNIKIHKLASHNTY